MFIRLPPLGILCLAVLTAITAGGGWLRWLSMRESLWLDELHTAWVISAAWSDISARARLGNNAPLYFYFVRAVTQLLGTHEWSLRSISFLGGVALIPATYAVARLWRCGRTTALLAAAFVALDRHAVFYSTEARTYGLVQVVALLHLVLFVQLLSEQRKSWEWLCWVVSAMLLFHLHVTTVLIFVAELLAALLLSIRQRTSATVLKRLLVGFAVVAVSAIPAVGLVRSVATRRHNWSLFIRQRPLVDTLTLYPLYLYFFVPLACSLCYAWWRHRQRPQSTATLPEQNHRQSVALDVCVVWVMLPLVLAWLLTEMDVARLFLRRYLIASSVSLGLMPALLISRCRPTAGAAAAVSLMLVGLACFEFSPAHRREDWRTAVATINQAAAGERVVLLDSGLIEAEEWPSSRTVAERRYLQFPLRSLYRLQPDRLVIPIPSIRPLQLTAEERERIRRDGAWLIVRGPDRVASSVDRVLAHLRADLPLGEPLTFHRIVAIPMDPPK